MTNYSLSNQLQTIIRRRRMLVIVIISAFLALLILFNLGNFIFLHRMSDQLETELGRRLISIATLSAELVENELPNSFAPNIENELTLTVIRDRLQNIRTKHQLEGLFIINPDYETLLDSHTRFELMSPRTYLKTDSSWIKEAWQGQIVSSPLHTINAQKFKSAYAPIQNLSGDIIGVLVAEANAYFFALLERYKNTFVITALTSSGVFILFVAILFYALRLLMKTQENLRNTERLAMMGQMSAVLAHEIRNPLGIIRGAADVLRSRYQKEEPDPMFQYIPDEVNRLNKLVNNFLFLSRNTPLQMGRINLNRLIDDTIEKVRLDEKQDGVDIQFQKSELQAFYFDPDGIAQVLMNLFRNSIQAIEPGGKISVKTELIRKKRDRFVRVSVTDNGMGIDGDPSAVFEPFYTTKSTGSGLGMAVSKKVIENHGGWMEISSKPGEMTTVSFVIPFREQKGEEVGSRK